MGRRRAHALAHARRLLVETGVQAPEHIDPIATARHLGIEIALGQLVGATARIYRIGARARMRVSDQIVQPGRLRFSIAHELGHYVLGHGIAGGSSITDGSGCGYRSADEEYEADAFAAEHLMPLLMEERFCDGPIVGLARPREIASVFRVSPVASTLRYVEISRQRCAVVYSVAGIIRWVKRSRSSG